MAALRRAQQLTLAALRSHRVKAFSPVVTRSKSHHAQTYNVSQTVLHIEAMDNPKVVPYKAATHDALLKKVMRNSTKGMTSRNNIFDDKDTLRRKLHTPDGQLDRKAAYVTLGSIRMPNQYRMFIETLAETKEGAQWILDKDHHVAKQLTRITETLWEAYVRYLCLESGFRRRAAQDLAADIMRHLRLEYLAMTIDLLQSQDLKMGPFFCAFGLRESTMFKDRKQAGQIGRYLRELVENDYRVQTSPEQFSLFLRAEDCDRSIFLLDGREDIQRFQHLNETEQRTGETELREECWRDVIVNKEQYEDYLDVLFALNDREQLRIEWRLQNDIGYLQKPSFRVAASYISAFLAQDTPLALEILERSTRHGLASTDDYGRLLKQLGELSKMMEEGNDVKILLRQARKENGEHIYRYWLKGLNKLKAGFTALLQEHMKQTEEGSVQEAP